MFEEKEFFILDGAMGTELGTNLNNKKEKKGIKLDEKLWSSICLINNEKDIYQIHYDVHQ
jgi:S-methylmethionine-dependent homocysteine/selenocysteine methylase